MPEISAVGTTWTLPPLNMEKDVPPKKEELEPGVEGQPFPNLLSEFVYKRTYSRWLPEMGRRETWAETVQRYMDFVSEERDIPRHIQKEIQAAILKMEVLPSMRALWAAGEAAKRDNTCMYNCFAGSEKFQTPEGSVTFKDALGASVVVRTADGEWRPATVQHFGKQMLFDVVLEHWTGGKHGNETQTIRVTGNHRWLLQDGSETTALKVGDKLASPNMALQVVDEEAVRHGFVFGDGTLNRNESGEYAQVRLCGKKARLLDEVFGGFNRSFPPSYDGDPVVYCGKENTHWKQLPQTTNPQYIAGFLQGLFLADGCGVSTSGNLRFSSQDEDLVEWVREYAPLAGFKFLTDQVYDEPTAYGTRSNPLHMFLLGSGDSAIYRVQSLTPVGVDEVYCVVEPVTRTFTLACGQVTGNCSFLPMDNLKAFSELLYILMQGTGVGFSVESRFVDRLPMVREASDTIIHYTIEDSTEGWSDALWFGVQQWWKGYKVAFDYSNIRPAGSPLKIKGGRASGPEPLRKLMAFAEETVLAAAGRQLRPLEAHDICCQIAEIVMVGGFRRAALISFSDPDDEEIRHAKDWTRGDFPPIRYMSNNTAVYEGQPSEGQFWDEWKALVNSRSGERGFFSYPQWRREERNGECRSNPCVTGDTWVNTETGPCQVKDLVGIQTDVVVDGASYSTTEEGFWATGEKQVYRLGTQQGFSLDLTANHQVCRVVQDRQVQRFEWVEAKDLQPGDKVRLNNHRAQDVEWTDQSVRGWLLGNLIGDGTFVQNEGKSNEGCLRFWGGDGETDVHRAFEMLKTAGLPFRKDMKPFYHPQNKYWELGCVSLAGFAAEYGIQPSEKTITSRMEQQSNSFAAGVLRGLFDADGSVMGSQEKGVSVRLSQSELGTLQAAQRMLLRLGVISTLYLNRREAQYRDLPDGKGGVASYWCKAQHELVIARDNLFRFAEVVGFFDRGKQARLENLLGSYKRTPNRERFVATIKDLTPLGKQTVFDCSVPGLNAFDANGLYVHNCGEILLRYNTSEDAITGVGGSGSFCNLTSAVMRSYDTMESMAKKVRLATWLGAIQATFTHFPYLRPGWKEVCEQDRLLGVDITGQCDNPNLSTDSEVMSYLNSVARDTAAEATAYLGINMPMAITCGKPSGNSSQLVDCASGFHPRYAPYYFRHVRIAASDPLFKMVRDSGVPVFPESGQEHMAESEVTVWVVRFPVKAPEKAIFRQDETALEQCNRYLQIMETWCGERGHNQSATIYVRDNEWEEIGQWVWDNFDKLTGLTFLPFDGGQYRLPPYQEIDQAEYEAAEKAMPDVDFDFLGMYERSDRGNGAQELACRGGSCEL